MVLVSSWLDNMDLLRDFRSSKIDYNGLIIRISFDDNRKHFYFYVSLRV